MSNFEKTKTFLKSKFLISANYSFNIFSIFTVFQLSLDRVNYVFVFKGIKPIIIYSKKYASAVRLYSD